MQRVQKEEQIATLKTELATAQSLLLTDFRGITVSADTELRNEFRKAGCQYRVVKNTLLGLAVKGTPMEAIADMLEGPTGIAYSAEDAAAPAKVLVDFAKKEEKLTVKGGYLDGKSLDARGVEALSKMPGKDEMRATFIATLQAVPQTFLRLTSAAPQNFMHLLNARRADQEGK